MIYGGAYGIAMHGTGTEVFFFRSQAEAKGQFVRTPKKRSTVRAILLTPKEEILLLRIQEPSTKRAFWYTPGGGIEPGEEHEACLRREIAEETGCEGFEIGPAIWSRRITFEWAGRLIDQEEIYYLVQAPRFEPRMVANPSPGEAEGFRGFRWWTSKEISRSTEDFSPRDIGLHLSLLIEHGPPPHPVDISAR